MTVNLLVLRTSNLEESREFYSALGARFEAERHGGGLEHYAATLGGLVLELYPCVEGHPPEAGLRLGLAVPDLRRVLVEVGQDAKPRQTPWGLRAVVRDPDGRAVELTQF